MASHPLFCPFCKSTDLRPIERSPSYIATCQGCRATFSVEVVCSDARPEADRVRSSYEWPPPKRRGG